MVVLPLTGLYYPRSILLIQVSILARNCTDNNKILKLTKPRREGKVLSNIILKLISVGLSWDNCSKLLRYNTSISIVCLFSPVINHGIISVMVEDQDNSMSSQSQIAPMPWTPLTSNSVTALLHIKPPLDLRQVIIRNIISGVRIGLDDDAKENSHIQLLLVLVTKHGERIFLDDTIIGSIEETANMSDSFLKKSIQNQIKALKRKVQPFAETQG
jgi:hypothetical protein